jgi:TonB family protein
MYRHPTQKCPRTAIVMVAFTLAIIVLRLVIPVEAQTPVPGIVPYTVVLNDIFIDPQGNSHQSPIQTTALRSDGALMVQLGPAEEKKTIFLPTGELIVAVPKSAMKTTYSRKDDPRDRILDPTTSCTKYLNGRSLPDTVTVLGEDTISGHRTVKHKSGAMTQWLALDCGCAVVQRKIDFDRQPVIRETRLVSLKKGEPDPSLFAVPSHYKEVKPSVAYCGGECPPNTVSEEFLRQLDRDHETGRFGGGFAMGAGDPAASRMGVNSTGRIQITYKEKAQYTPEARENNVRGTVALRALFQADGTISDITIVRGLPHGLNEKAIEAAQKVRFRPAVKDGKPVSVYGNLEFTFNFVD